MSYTSPVVQPKAKEEASPSDPLIDLLSFEAEYKSRYILIKSYMIPIIKPNAKEEKNPKDPILYR